MRSTAVSSASRRVAWIAAGTAAGTLAGIALAGSVAAFSGGDAEGAGYGGTSSVLKVAVSGETVTVDGVGFAAASDVEVRIGELSTTVKADEVGAVHAVLNGAADGPARASGLGADGRTATLTSVAPSAGGAGGSALIGAVCGTLGAVATRRRRPA